MEETDPLEVLLYETANAVVPMEQWLESLDRKSRARILARIAKIRSGNLGDWSSLTNSQGVCEFREFFGPGYRIYFARESQKIVILLCGSDMWLRQIRSEENNQASNTVLARLSTT